MSRTPSILMVSKPVCPPWNDSGKNLVYTLARRCAGYSVHLMAMRDTRYPEPHLAAEPVYAGSSAFSPGLWSKARVFKHLMFHADEADLLHFFFAPNALTSAAARAVLAMHPRKSVQTVSSSPADYTHLKQWLFADRVVVVSQHNLQRCREAGIEQARLIYPGVDDAPAVPHEARTARRNALRLAPGDCAALYAGDYEFAGAGGMLADIAARCVAPNLKWIIACRRKTAEAATLETQWQNQFERAGLKGRVQFVGEVDDIHTLLAACDLHVFPAQSVYAKMDIPLVLLETLQHGRPVLVGDFAPLNELARGVGVLVLPKAEPAAWAATIDRIAVDPNPRRALGEGAKTIVGRHFSADAMARQYMQLYDELLNAP